ncbi:MAG: 50S ribosomal protein L5 [Methylacidiphilales bacterium]|nr:50S ribosomal protein L5 [Candidatus Methylacidiphilales bacterium]
MPAAVPVKEPVTLAREYKERIIPALRQSRGYKNVMQVPKIEKVVVNCCIGSAQDTKVALEDALNEIQMITGQRPVKTKSTKSIANFKLREGQEIGVKVTLRGPVMYEFLERLIRTALPRIRDFRGVSPRAFDGRGNYTLGVKDQTIFPEVELDKVKRNLGMDITIVTTARKNDEAKELLALFGMPFSDRKLTTAPAQ